MKKLMGLFLVAATLFVSAAQAAPAQPEDVIVGIGATLEKMDDGTIQVQGLVAGTPAEHSGLAVGDLLRAVVSAPGGNVIELQDMQLQDAVALIRGNVGVPVEITYTRGDSAPMTLSIVREQFLVN